MASKKEGVYEASVTLATTKQEKGERILELTELKQELEALQAQADATVSRMDNAATRLQALRGVADAVRRELDIDRIQEQVEASQDGWRQALRKKLELQNQLASDLAGDEAERIASEVTAEVEIDFATRAEELKAAKQPNNQAVRDAEVKRRLTTNTDYQTALMAQDAAKSEMRTADAEVAIVDRQYQTALAVFKSRIALAQMWAV